MMAFIKKTWKDRPDTSTPLDANGLNDVESRIGNEIDDITTQLEQTNSRFDDVITTPVDGNITQQEIIDARQNEVSLGANLTSIKQDLLSHRLPIKNELLNSDFAKGETLWNGFSDNVKIVNNELVVDTNSGVGFFQSIDTFDEGDIFYLHLKTKSDGVGKVYIRLRDSQNIQVSPGIITGTHTQFKADSIIMPVTNNGDRLSITRETETQNTVTISNMLLINLTKSFGKGKEPSKAEMDDFVINLATQWFDGHLGSNVFLMNLYNFIDDITIFEDDIWEEE